MKRFHQILQSQIQRHIGSSEQIPAEFDEFLQAIDETYADLLGGGGLPLIEDHTPRETLQMVLDAIPTRVFWKDKDSVLVGCNRPFANDFGLERIEDIIGKTDHDIINSRAEAETVRRVDRRIMLSGKPEFRIREALTGKHDSEVSWLETNKIPLFDHLGNVIGILGTYEDITERVNAEENLANANAELARASRLKDEFLAGMSHELRTPLNSILGLSEALREGIYGPLEERQNEAIERIENGGRHLLSLINDILDIAKFEAGESVVDFVPVGVRSVCKASISFVQEMAQQKNIFISYGSDDAIDFFYADERRLKQILINLLSNAVKFTPDGGDVELSVRTNRSAGTVSFVVADTGIGIARDDMQKLFQPFVQIDSSLSRKFEGAGLGLSLVKHMVEMHGGRIDVDSEPDVGSTFRVSLPWRTKPDDAPLHLNETSSITAVPADQPRLGNTAASAHRCLVVEDSQEAAQQVVRYLDEINVSSIRVACGGQVATAVGREKPDLIILDIMLPDISGWEVLDQLRSNALTARIPVVVTSIIDNKKAGEQHGADEYLVKPFGREELHAAVNRLLASRPQHDEIRVSDARGNMGQSSLQSVLIADDNPENTATFRDYLQARGYRTFEAIDGHAAIEVTRAERPDLILMDVQMPTMDGLEATKILRADPDPEIAATPIVAVTAMAMASDDQRCLDAGANAYLAKPVSLRTLAETISGLIKEVPGNRSFGKGSTSDSDHDVLPS